MSLSLHPLGLAVGSVFSLVLFKRRMWPITFGLGENVYLQLGGRLHCILAGSGFGMGYNNCERDFNEPYMVHVSKLKKVE